MEGITLENFDDFINHIYDKIFKLFFKHKPVAVDCLTHFVDKNIVDKLDLDELTLKDTNFITKGLEEYFSDVIYETYLKAEETATPKSRKSKKNEKKKARVVLIWEHKYGIESYFKLFAQILNYKVQQYFLDILANREPTFVLPIILNQGVRPLKNKNFHDSFTHIPSDLLIFVENFECYIINVHSIGQDILLKMKDDNLLRGLFLAYQAVESKGKKEDALAEIFKFVQEKDYFTAFFQPLLAFIVKKGQFSQPKITQLLNRILTPDQQQNKMVAQLSLGDKWEARGEKRGEKRGKTLGKKQEARLTVLRGYFNAIQTVILELLSGLPQSEVFALGKGYETVKKAWQEKKIDISALAKETTLNEEEINYVLNYLDSMPMA
jgi:predicted transposase YdaD